MHRSACCCLVWLNQPDALLNLICMCVSFYVQAARSANLVVSIFFDRVGLGVLLTWPNSESAAERLERLHLIVSILSSNT
jgi:hypothetical protein